MSFPLGLPIFRGYVKFPGCSHLSISLGQETRMLRHLPIVVDEVPPSPLPSPSLRQPPPPGNPVQFETLSENRNDGGSLFDVGHVDVT